MVVSFSTATVTILFCDCTESTARLARLGDELGDTFRHQLFARLTECVSETGGTVVKHLGDGLMVVFERSVIGAVRCAAQMHQSVTGIDPDDPVALRIGISIGEAVEEDGDWFGMPVIEAARLCSAAGAGQTLAHELLATLSGSRASDHRFYPLGPMKLKGLGSPFGVVQVDGTPPGDEHAPPRGRPRMRKRAFGAVGVMMAIAVTALILSIGTPEGSSPDPPVTGALRRGLTSPVGYTPLLHPSRCEPALVNTVPDLECSELVVPQSRSDPQGPTISLPVQKLAGPRSSTVDPIILMDVNEPISRTSLREAGDVFALSPRGFAGESRADLQCSIIKSTWTAALAKPSTDPTAIESKVEAAASCAKNLRETGHPPSAFNLNEVALDIRDLALALGTPRVAIASGGYFTLAAVAFVRTQPDAVSSMILSNPVPPGESILAKPAQSLAVAFSMLVGLCTKDRVCARSFPDLSEAYRLRHKSLADAPVLVTSRSLDGQGPYEILLDSSRMASSLETSMQSSEQLGLVPSGIVDADNELIAGLSIHEDLSIYIGEDSFGPTFLSMVCSYDQRASRLSEIGSRTHQLFGGANDPSLPDVCAAWDVPSVLDELSPPLEVDVPAMLIEGGFATAGVNNWAEKMALLLPKAVVVRFQTLSEDVAFEPPQCLTDLRTSFLREPGSVDREDARKCGSEASQIEFAGRE